MVADAARTITVEDICARYLRDKIDLNNQSKSQHWALVAVRRRLGPVPCEGLTEADVVSFRRARRADGLADASIRKEISALNAALEWGVRRSGGLLPKDTPRDFALPPMGAPRQNYLVDEDEKKLWDAAALKATGNLPDRFRRGGLFVCIALQTAARAGAIKGLTWDRVDFDARVIDFRDPEISISRKRRVSVPISAKLMPVLQDAYARRGTSPLVLEHSGSIRKGFETLRDSLGLDCTVHDLRRTWATLRAGWGVPLEQIAEVLGDDLKTVRRHYAVFQPGYLRSAMDVDGPMHTNKPSGDARFH